MVTTINKTSYTSLLNQISSTYEHARRTVVKTYWDIGRLIVAEEERHDSETGYGLYLMRRISADLIAKYGKGFSVTNLKGMRNFYLRYRIGQAPDQLTWTHYQLLSTVPDEKVRSAIECKVIQEALSSRELEAIIIQEKKGVCPEAHEIDVLTTTRGALWTYSVQDVLCIPKKDNVVIVDCGFNVLREYVTRATLKKGDCVVLQRGRARSEKVSLSRVPQSRKDDRYMYQAFVEKVIDGDTLWAYIDTGMGVWVREKLRLRGIDTPELKTKKGQIAKRFVMKELKKCPFIVIRTLKSDKYDRYLADIFYLPQETDVDIVAQKGRYLNQELLTEHLAHVM